MRKERSGQGGQRRGELEVVKGEIKGFKELMGGKKEKGAVGRRDRS